MDIIIGKQGNQKMPISDPTVSRKHCKVTVNSDGTYTIANLSTTSFTKVDGRDIIKTQATLDSEIQLGPIFKARLRDLIGVPKENPMQKEFSISHLEKIWKDFNTKNLAIVKKQQKLNLTRTGLGIFTMCAMPTIFFLGPIGYALTGIGVIGNIYSFVGLKNIESPELRQKRYEEFENVYVCPNPECGRSFPMKSYSYIKQNYLKTGCPYCKCRYVEK